MAAVEIALAPLASAGAGAFDSTPSASGAANGRENFDRVMQAKLSPHGGKLPGKIALEMGKSPLVAKDSAAAGAPHGAAQKNDEPSATKPVSGEKTLATADGEKDGGKITADNVAAVPLDAGLAPLIYALLPAFGISSGRMSTIGNSDVSSAGGPRTPELQPATVTLAPATSVSQFLEKAGSTSSAPLSPKLENSTVPAATNAGLPGMVEPNGGAAAAAKQIPQKDFVPVNEMKALLDAKPSVSNEITNENPLPTATETSATPAASSEKRVSESGAQRAGAETIGSPTDAGTGVAINAALMKNPQKTIKVAGLDAKVLPVGDHDGAHEKNLPMPRLMPAARGGEHRGTDFNFAFANSANQTPPNERTSGLNALDLPSLADARMRALDRTHDMMALHSMRLTESKSDTLAVIIKPAVGTELSLELRQRAGGIEAQATLTRGDHQFLSQHWSELQQRLEQRGIKLAPLGNEMAFSGGDPGQFQRQQPSPEDAAQQAAAFAEFASVAPVGGAVARHALARDGWESWA